jgi:hypothetical protein
MASVFPQSTMFLTIINGVCDGELDPETETMSTRARLLAVLWKQLSLATLY